MVIREVGSKNGSLSLRDRDRSRGRRIRDVLDGFS